MFLPYPTKVNRDLGCSPKPMSKPAQHGVIHVGQPWSISQARNQFRVSHRFGRAEMGQPCSTPSQQQEQQRLVASFPSLTEGFVLAGAAHTLMLVQHMGPQLLG